MPLAVKQYDPIVAILRSALLANVELVTGPTWTVANDPDIHSKYINEVDNPNYPALTICAEHSSSPINGAPLDKNRYYIHGWSKNGPDEVSYLYNLVMDTFIDKLPDGLTYLRKIDGKCPLYDDATRTYYFMSEWLIHANQSLIYV